MSFDADEALDIFITEARELLESFEEGLLALEGDPDDAETINAIFRSAHTLKGSSGLFGLNHLVGFAHVVETLLGHVREGEVRVTPELISVLLPCADHITRYVEGVAEGRIDPSPAEKVEADGLLARLAPFEPAGTQEKAAAPEAEAPTGPRDWLLQLRFGPDCLRNGMDPLSLLRHLSTLGDVTRIAVDDSALPEASDMDPETNYLAFEAALHTEAPKSEIEAVRSSGPSTRDACSAAV
jgi:two-component system chemotaxis sensor kinase CheA